MVARPHCAVVGAGIIGLSAAWRLGRRGAKVTLFDSLPFGHGQGSSHGPTRLLRIAYFEKPDYTPLAIRSVLLWRELESEVRDSLFCQSGALFTGPPHGFLVGGARKAGQLHNLALKSLNAAQTRERFPWLRCKQNFEAVIEEGAGYILAEKAMSHLHELLKASGVEILQREAVLNWADAGNGVKLETRRRTAKYDHAVIAAGVWSPSLLGMDIAPISARSKSLFWTAGDERLFNTASGFKPFAVETTEGRMFYGFPALDADGIKIGEHTGGTPLIVPAQRPAAPGAQERLDLLAFLEAYAPGLPKAIKKEDTCLYEMSPDGDFLIGRHPKCDFLSFAAGLSGHGFKFAPMIGEALAEVAYEKPLGAEFQFLSPMRFWKPGLDPV